MNISYIIAAVIAVLGFGFFSRRFDVGSDERAPNLILGTTCAACIVAVGWALGVDAQHIAAAAADTTLQARSEERARAFVSSLGLRVAGIVCSSHRRYLPNGPVACTAGTESGTVLELSCNPDLPAGGGAPCALARTAP